MGTGQTGREACRPGEVSVWSLRPSAAVMGIAAAGRLALAFRGLKALAPSGGGSSHWSYLPMSAFLIMASSPVLVLACTAWLLQVIRPGRDRQTHTQGGAEGARRERGETL